jgi:hypothetical protein
MLRATIGARLKEKCCQQKQAKDSSLIRGTSQPVKLIAYQRFGARFFGCTH